MDPTGIHWILERINWLIGRFSDREERNTKERRDAIHALLTALSETRIHFGTQRNKKERDRAKEEEISRLWTEASHRVQPFDDDLANRCYSKGTFWADPIGWDNDALLATRISIEEVEQSLKRLKDA